MLEVHDYEFQMGVPKSLLKLSEYGYCCFACTSYSETLGVNTVGQVLRSFFPILEGTFVRTPSLLAFSLDELPRKDYEFVIAIPPWFFDE